MVPNTIIKRDGRKRKFQPAKIYNGLVASMISIGALDDELAKQITDKVVDKFNQDIVKSEDIYDGLIFEIIASGNYELATSYASHRDDRNEIREVKSGLMKTIDKLAKETTRDNANIKNGPSGKMLQIGSEASKWYNLANMPKHIANAHKRGWIHIHDLDFYEKTINCVQINLEPLLRNGFNNGYGFIRPPKRISSAAALAAIILQSSQNDMFGGQAYGQFDTYMAPYVPKDYVKAMKLATGKDDIASRAKVRVNEIHNEVYQAMEGFVYNLNSMQSRAGAQTPFSSVNFGCDITPEGQLISEMLLKAFEAGLGRGETPLFPNMIFRLKDGINMKREDPNYYLFQLACEVTSRRMNPTFSFMDASFNSRFGIQTSYMGCRSRVMANINGPEIAERRGNIGFVTMNLVRCAIEAKGNLEKFYKHLDKLLALCEEQLLHRYEVACRLRVKDLPFLMGEKLYLGSEGLGPNDSIREAIKHGTLTIGYIGIAETMKLLCGKHHGEDSEVHHKALEIAEYISSKVKEMTKRYHLNFTTIASPAEGVSGRFVQLDLKKYGVIEGITNKEYYSNSYHIQVDHKIGMFDKLRLEGPFHKYCDAGHISYVELDGAPINNPKAIETLVLYAAKQDIGYLGINFPIDYCTICGQDGIIENKCPRCGSTSIKRIRRITGYLAPIDRFGDGKTAELKARATHN